MTGFKDGDPYEIGATLPTPACSVRDEDAGASATPSVGALTGTLVAYGLGTVTVTCAYPDSGGLSGSDDATYSIVDTGAPGFADKGLTAGTLGTNGWYTSAVTNKFTATDAGAGFETAKPKLLTKDVSVGSGTTEGSAVTVNSGIVSDVAGNPAAAIDSAKFMVDLTNPLLNISGAADKAIFNVCDTAPSKPTFSPTDAVSGLDGSQSDSWTTPTAASGVGTYTYTAQAKDLAGRTASETRTYKSTYGGAFTGIEQPINGGTTPELTDDNSRFKLGSTVPVKFKMVCNGAPVTNAVAKLNVKQADGSPDPGADEAISSAASTTGNLFRYDATAGQYIFNLSTKSGYLNPGSTTEVAFSPGTWTLKVGLDDGTWRSVVVQLVK